MPLDPWESPAEPPSSHPHPGTRLARAPWPRDARRQSSSPGNAATRRRATDRCPGTGASGFPRRPRPPSRSCHYQAVQTAGGGHRVPWALGPHPVLAGPRCAELQGLNSFPTRLRRRIRPSHSKARGNRPLSPARASTTWCTLHRRRRVSPQTRSLQRLLIQRLSVWVLLRSCAVSPRFWVPPTLPIPFLCWTD